MGAAVFAKAQMYGSRRGPEAKATHAPQSRESRRTQKHARKCAQRTTERTETRAAAAAAHAAESGGGRQGGPRRVRAGGGRCNARSPVPGEPSHAETRAEVRAAHK